MGLFLHWSCNTIINTLITDFCLRFYFLQVLHDMIDLLDGEGKTLDQVCLKRIPTQGECTLVMDNTSQVLGAEKHPVQISPFFYQRFLQGFLLLISFNPLVSRQPHKEGEEANWSPQSAGENCLTFLKYTLKNLPFFHWVKSNLFFCILSICYEERLCCSHHYKVKPNTEDDTKYLSMLLPLYWWVKVMVSTLGIRFQRFITGQRFRRTGKTVLNIFPYKIFSIQESFSLNQ